MKLHAQTTSNRASKGQGGDYLDIVVTDKDRKEIALLSVRMLKNNIQIHFDVLRDGYERTGKGYFHTLIGASETVDDREIAYDIEQESKGKKQKDESKVCDNCSVNMSDIDYANGSGYCPNCR